MERLGQRCVAGKKRRRFDREFKIEAESVALRVGSSVNGGQKLSRWLRLAALLPIAALVGGFSVHAGTIEVSVEERGAGPVPDQMIALYPVTPDIQADLLYFFNTRAVGRCTTGPTGRCQVTGLPVGVYVPFLFPIADPSLVAPIGPPMVAYGTATLSKADARARLRIELQRGVRIQFRVVSEGAAIPTRSRVELSNDGGEKAETALDARGRGQITLTSGRWVAHLAGPAGARIVMVELDGGELTTVDVPIELRAPSSDRFVTWTLSPPCRVRGRVTTDTGEPPRVAIQATLVTPGPWGRSALCRATTCAPSSMASVDLTGNYLIELPSGTWRIAPIGVSFLESDPPFGELSCGEGQEVRADFNIREKESAEKQNVLVVRVLGDDDQPMPDVPVEVWPSRGNLDVSRPIASETTGRYGGAANFSKLAAGTYLLRARSPGYRIAVVAVSGLDPEASLPRQVTIRLDRGATIDALATDEKDRPVTGVGLKVKGIVPSQASDDPATRLAESEVELSVPPSKDQTGHVLATGLVAGEYEVTPVLSRSAASTALINDVAGSGTAEKSVVLHLGEHDRKDVIIRVRPAASLAGQLVCTDGGLLPRQADTCVLGLPAGDEDDAARDGCSRPVIPSASVTLSGDRQNAFLVGPLTPGSFRLALRPRGYTNWTWVLGTPDGEQAAVVQVNGNDAVELGSIPVLCGPAVEVKPTVLSRDPLPDLTLALVSAELTRTSPEGKVERRVVTAERGRERVAIRELPEGEWTLDLSMSHPFFVPALPVRLSLPVKLDRGVQLRAGVEIVSAGGAVVIDSPAGSARVTGPDGKPRLESATDGRIAIDGVVPGSYRVELCEDASCARVLKQWDAVQVVRGKKLVLTTADEPVTPSN